MYNVKMYVYPEPRVSGNSYILDNRIVLLVTKWYFGHIYHTKALVVKHSYLAHMILVTSTILWLVIWPTWRSGYYVCQGPKSYETAYFNTLC